uniref:Uncharacterized protein n=1 Tax=Rhizophora mucronata TaxID=61149 RepID=A0A2P2J1F4_RHIMU
MKISQHHARSRRGRVGRIT